MASRRVISSVVLVLVGALAAAPALADAGQRRRGGDGERDDRADQGQRERAVPRSRAGGRSDGVRSDQAPQVRAQLERQYRAEQQARVQQQYRAEPQAQRQYRSGRQYDPRGGYAVRRDYQRPSYQYQRPYYPSYSYRGGHGSRTVIVPRYISPRIVTVVPYRPYVYRPRLGIGLYYGAGGAYPYGYTPRGYYDPIVGRAYGGLRITGASHIAQIFADGYYVGIADDFDGVFQHLNLEAGPHQIEIREPGLQPIAFDVMIQPGRTITFRADVY
jgi:hypothetical protein